LPTIRAALASPASIAWSESRVEAAWPATYRIHLSAPVEISMCRNIKTLFNFDPPASDDEIRAASLQFVRKLSGFTKPSKANEAAFHRAVDDVSAAAGRLLASLVTTGTPRNREVERAKAQARSTRRFGGSPSGTMTT